MSDLARDKVIELLIEKYSTVIHKIAYEILKDWHLVEDVEQEILFKLIERYEDKLLLPQDELKSYLCTAAKNTAINIGRKNGAIQEAEELYFTNAPLTMEAVDIAVLYDEYGFGIEMQDILRTLDNIDRDIICLQYGEGYQRKEIAEILGVSEEFVKKRVYRARIKIKSILVDRKED
ncbi:sigma-70 family RNA polymerase sigma factor [Anaerovoracaceae bacterium 41-7]|uniref:Sigma-70 family RNA polymerase sigma factor n=1 Tax=Anaerotruncus colihominis TaxID=169435 RepID=A0A845QFW9_9FIRM|nr:MULTISPECIES: sigma-70 family RNA polymerase sigma factor [Anaerotruncus]MCI9639859.1 sigma-70 family RNA polymerase sigma factor [Emergencia sp.]NBH60912.1 sigma-70 family RNA polymerase sigma factor [Anaerotruncus colihominis]NCF01567.1 sigma-70 family RNA polymerase sigma factor [Anaerotruncus sp. 80]